MALYATVEVAVHVEHFKNIDLYNQGFYRCDFKIYHIQGDAKVYSQPLDIKVSEVTKKRRRVWKEVRLVFTINIISLTIHSNPMSIEKGARCT